MYNTYNQMKQVLNPIYNGLDLETLSDLYKQENLNPSILAEAFCQVFGLLLNIQKEYYWVHNDDMASFSLEKLDICLQTYNRDKGKFITYYCNVLKTRLKELSKSENTHKRKVNIMAASYDELVEGGFDQSEESNDYFNADLTETLKVYGLSEKELVYCLMVLKDYSSKEIADYLNVSIMTISNIKKRLKTKLVDLHLEYR